MSVGPSQGISRASFLLGRSSGKSISLPFRDSRVACIPWLVQKPAITGWVLLSCFLLLLPRPLWLHGTSRIIRKISLFQDQLISTLILTATLIALCHVTHSQFLGMRPWALSSSLLLSEHCKILLNYFRFCVSCLLCCPAGDWTQGHVHAKHSFYQWAI